jgi:transcription factor IIIB 90 kDa subunit
VSTDAVRLIQRFDRDWMTKGRRPAGICGAALLLAARMNNFRRSVEEIVQVVKIADSTVRKRLEEFKGTRSGELTVADFRSVWLEEEMDPPAFVKGKEREREETEGGDADEEVEGGRGKQKAGKKKKRKRGEEIEDEQAQETENALLSRQAIDPALLNEGILAGAMDPTPSFLPDDHDSTDANIDPSLLPPRQPSRTKPPDISLNSTLAPPPTDIIDESANTIIAQEVATFLQNTQGAMLSSVLDEAEERRLAQITVIDDLMGLDEDELDRFILSEDEVKIKERVWVELNKEYLEAIAGELILEDMFYQSLLLNGCLLHSERGTGRNGHIQSQE